MEQLEQSPNAGEERAILRRRKRQTVLILLGISVLQFPIWGLSTLACHLKDHR